MNNKNFLATFDTQAEVLQQIEDLKMQGTKEDHMYVMAKDEEQISLVRGRTDVDYKTSEGDWMDKFIGFLSGNEPSRQAISSMGLDEEETQRYYNEVQNGKILLFVDQDLGSNYDEQSNDARSSTDYENSSDELIGAGGGGGASVYNPTTNLSSDPYLSGTDTGLAQWQDNTNEINRDGMNLYGKENIDKENETRMRNENLEDVSTNEAQGSYGDQERIRLHEERLQVDKDRIQTGEVNVGKHIVEENQTIEVPVEREELYVERRPVNEETTSEMGNNFANRDTENEEIRIPLTEERVNVSKTDVVSEEIVVGKRKIQDTETINETVRKEEADIDEGPVTSNGRKEDDTSWR